MGKISKNANIYDTEGNLLRHVNEHGRLDKMSIEELEELIDKLGEDKDENGNIKNPTAFNNASSMLFQMYQKYGNPHATELLERAQNIKTSEQEVTEKLQEVQEVLEPEIITEPAEVTNETIFKKDEDKESQYVEFEEIPAA